MSLDMAGHIDGVFRSIPASRKEKTGAYVNGVWAETESVSISHRVTVQPLNDKEIQTLSIGGEREMDARKIYVNDGDLFSIKPSDVWTLTGIPGLFKCIKMDNRPWRNYCKIIVSKQDD